MIKKIFSFKSCSSTAGKPFEYGPKCPLYLKTNGFLQSGGWQQMFYNAHKTGSGDLCNTKYKKIEKIWDGVKDHEVLGMLDVNIEGTKHTCSLTAVVCTYNPKNILKTIDHACEKDIMGGLESFLKENTVILENDG